MGSSKKNKDRDKKKKKRERSRSKEREKDRHHKHHHKHKKHKRSREERSPSIDLSDLSLSDLEFPDDRPEVSSKKGNYRNSIPSPPPAPKFPKQIIPSPSRTPSLSPPPISPPRKQRIAPPPPRISETPNDAPPTHGKEVLSLSIEETNKIRAKLGLKPLAAAPTVKEDQDDSYKPGEEIHRPPENLADKLHIEKLREKIAAQREKRRQKEALSRVKGLGESDEEGSAKAWVSKSRKIEEERKEAEKRNKMLEELDAQFGVGELVEEELTHRKKHLYDSKHLSGLKVEHDTSRFDEGPTILTLKDSSILENAEDSLVNYNLLDLESAEKNVKRKRMKPDEVEYDAPEVDEHGRVVQKALLTKYDEEIDGETRQSFRIGFSGYGIQPQHSLPPAVSKMAKLRRLTSLAVPETQLATAYLTSEEAAAFSKKKKKRKKKKQFMLTADDLEPLPDTIEDHGNRQLRLAVKSAMNNNRDDELNNGSQAPHAIPTKSLRDLIEDDDDEPATSMQIDDELNGDESDEEDDDIELQEALSRSRRAKLFQRSAKFSHERITEIVASTDNSSPTTRTNNSSPLRQDNRMETDEDDINMTLNITDEFCRTLGDIPTYGLSGNRAEDDNAMLGQGGASPTRYPHDGVASTLPGHSQEQALQQPPGSSWEEVQVESTRVEISNEKSAPILEEEPDTGRGVANALRLAMKKGYLEKDNSKKPANATLQHLRAVHYSIEDKAVEDDRRGRGGNERYMGPVTDFKEKDIYKPDVKLEYVDDEGRKLNAKEAFRYLSHKFHGKGSGKNKLEKRMKKWKEESLMKHMSSSDTPLQTLERQREKQRQLGSAYIVLSGSKPQEPLDVKK